MRPMTSRPSHPTEGVSAALAARLVGLGLAAVFVVQAVVEDQQWLNGNAASRRAYLSVVAVAVVLLTATTLRVTGRRRGLSVTTLAAGATGGLAAGTSWALVAWLGPTMPRDAAGGIALIAAFAALAAAVGGRRAAGLRESCAAALTAAALGTALVFAVAELTIQRFPTRIPDLVGPTMPAGSTAEQVLRENRIEVVDGYVVLLFLLIALLAGLLAAPRVLADTTRGALR